MKNDVTVRVEEDASIDGIEVIIKAEERSALVEDIVLAVERCANDRNPRITVYQGNSRKSLSQQDIIRIYTENRKLIGNAVDVNTEGYTNFDISLYHAFRLIDDAESFRFQPVRNDKDHLRR